MSGSVVTLIWLFAALIAVAILLWWLVKELDWATMLWGPYYRPFQPGFHDFGWTGLLDERAPAEMTYDDVEEIVLRVLERDILIRPRDTFPIDADLVDDLHADGDDLSFLFVPILEERLGIRPTFSDWGAVTTPRQAAQMLYQCLQKQKTATSML